MRLSIGVLFIGVAGFAIACSGGNKTSPTAPSSSSTISGPAAATLSSIAVTGSAPAVGGTAQFTATATFSDGTTKNVTASATWASSNTTVLAVASTGVASGIGLGNANVQATYQGVSGLQLVSVTTSLPGRLAISTTANVGWSSIDVSVNGQSVGTLRKFFEPGGTLSCEAIADARLVAVVQPGNATFSAKSDRGTVWSGTRELSANGCLEVQLTCTDRNCSPAAPPPPAPKPPPPPTTARYELWGGLNFATYLGCFSCSEYASDSIFNEYGTYGSRYSSTSIWNHYSQYGSPYATYSACNPYTSTPPRVVNTATLTYQELTLNPYRPYAITDPTTVNFLRYVICEQ